MQVPMKYKIKLLVSGKNWSILIYSGMGQSPNDYYPEGYADSAVRNITTAQARAMFRVLWELSGKPALSRRKSKTFGLGVLSFEK